LSSEHDDPDQHLPGEEGTQASGPPTKGSTAYSVIKWLAIIFLGIPLGLLVIAALVFGICMIATNV
jgi:hypothetical protein